MSLMLIFLLTVSPVYNTLYGTQQVTTQNIIDKIDKNNAENPQEKNRERIEQSLMHPIYAHAFDTVSGTLYIGAACAIQDQEDKPYALAAADALDRAFIPLAPEQALLDNKEEQPNPSYGAQITHLTVTSGGCPAFVKQDEPDTLYFMHDRTDNTPHLISARAIHDAHGKVTAGIVCLTANIPSLENPQSRKAFFMAVKNHENSFGDSGSGIALATYNQALEKALEKKDTPDASQREQTRTKKTAKKKKNKQKSSKPIYRLMMHDATTGSQAGNKAAPLDKASDAIKINNSAQFLEVNDLYWDNKFKKLYIALTVETGDGSDDGARALVIASVSKGKLVIQRMVPDNAITADSIIGTRGSRSRVTIRKVRMIHTSTKLSYLIVVRAPTDSDRDPAKDYDSIYALPVVNGKIATTDPALGLLAKKTAAPHAVFSPSAPHTFITRLLTEEAIQADDMRTITNNEALVGGFELPGKVTDIFTAGDAVFVAVKASNLNHETDYESGIFYSQAVFDAAGLTQGWTPWRRAHPAACPITGMGLNTASGQLWFMPQDGEKPSITVKRTSLSTAEEPLSKHITSFFTRPLAHLASFPLYTTDESAIKPPKHSLLVATGYRKVWATERTIAAQDQLLPVEFTGGVMQELGLISTADIAVLPEESSRWLIVAGSQGMAVRNISRLHDTQQWWIRLGTYRHVRKVVVDGSYLYVLTPYTLDRIELSAALLTGKEQVHPITIAHARDFPQGRHKAFLDLIICGPLALLGTSSGLIRTGNSADIRTALDSATVNWTDIPLPESLDAVRRLVPISAALQDTEGRTHINSYVLNTSVHTYQSRIYRLSIEFKDTIDDTTCTLFPDYFIFGEKTFFFNTRSYCAQLATDGAIMMLAQTRADDEPAYVEILDVGRRSESYVRSLGKTYMLNVEEAHTFSNVTRDAALGSWIISGDFGVKLYE